MIKLETKRFHHSELKIFMRLIQWLFAFLVILAITGGLWNSVFAKSSSGLSDDFIPVTLHPNKRADYSQGSQSHNFQSVSLQIVTDILKGEDIFSIDQYYERLDEFFSELKLPVPSANSLPNTPPESISQISSFIDNQSFNQPTSASTEEGGFVDGPWPTAPLILTDLTIIPIVDIEGFVDRPWPTLPLILADLNIDPEGQADSGDSEGGGEDDNSGGNEDDKTNKNDGKDGDPDDGNAGKGNDDKVKTNINDDKDYNPDDGNAGQGNDDKDKNKNK